MQYGFVFPGKQEDNDKNQTLAAGESLRSYLVGTAWIMQTIFFMVAGLINSLLMLRTRFFSKASAWTGIIISVVGMGFFLPKIGLLLEKNEYDCS